MACASLVLKRIEAESGFCRCPEVLFAACELGAFDLLAEVPEALGSAAVAARLGVSSRGTELLLDACVSLKLLQVEVRREKGGSGALAKACMSLYPGSQVTVFDIPDVVQMAKRHFSFPEDERIGFCEASTGDDDVRCTDEHFPKNVFAAARVIAMPPASSTWGPKSAQSGTPLCARAECIQPCKLTAPYSRN
ncbi:acetylserotonin O-methyltransferase-like isoform X4 [Tursiops truncatus]|uniref:Acetylserotonin O-methyltransferase-like isoform X3 n=1 Tax=Tursiops truncatus TaxID=9739 RepID=A0A6J3QUD1_TURTR|nr:acetylserotonin O-methyltransferase-like isoform X3 [Tursiops truncatus]